MTQEEKDLLLKDLSARLPYNVIVKHLDTNLGSEGNLINICILDEITTTIINEDGYEDAAFLAESLPYLRPMSSMTEKEVKELENYIAAETISSQKGLFAVLKAQRHTTNFLYSRHLDVLDLIEKGLALEAPEGRYEIKER